MLRLITLVTILFTICLTPAIASQPNKNKDGNGNGYGHCKHEPNQNGEDNGEGHDKYDDQECPDQTDEDTDQDTDTNDDDTDQGEDQDTNDQDQSQDQDQSTEVNNEVNIDNNNDVTVDNSTDVTVVINNNITVTQQQGQTKDGRTYTVVSDPVINKKCASKRYLTATIGKSSKIKRVFVGTNAKNFKFIRSHGYVKVKLDMTGLKKDHYFLYVSVTTRKGKTLEYTRWFWTCKKKQAGQNSFVIVK